MKKPDIARGLALESGLTEAQAADCLDRVVHEIIAQLRQGKTAPLPGLGKFTHGPDGKLAFRRQAEAGVADRGAAEQVAQVVLRGLMAGKTVEIDGLGVFYPDETRFYRFEDRRLPQVFIAYVEEDRPDAERLYETLETAGFAPWMDTRKLLPGQNWPRAIECAIETSDFFLACFSDNSVAKKGGFQAEIRYALDCARQLPLDQIFVIPVRLSACRVPRVIQREYQWVDLLPDWARGIRRLLTTMRKELERRTEARQGESIASCARD